MLKLTKYLTDACGTKCIFRITDLSNSFKKIGTLFFFKYDTCEKMLNLFWDFNGLQ